MKNEFIILIADRNPHVRGFLKREMTAEGYRVRLAKNGREVVDRAYQNEPLDLLIIDVDLPDADEIFVLEKIQNRIPTLPVVVHTFLTEYLEHATILSTGAFVEKEGTNIDRLKKVVGEVLRRMYPHRFENRPETQK